MKNSVPPEWLDFVLQHNTRAIIIVDRTRTVRYANLPATRMLGVSDPEEIVGRPYADVIRGSVLLDENAKVIPYESFPSTRAFTEGVDTRNLIAGEIMPDGNHRWLSISAFPYKNPAGEVETVTIVYEDISSRKIHEDRLRFMVESSKLLSIETDLIARLNGKARLLVPSLADWCTVNLVERGRLIRVAVVHRDPSKIPLVEELAKYSEKVQGENAVINRVVKSGVAELVKHAGGPETIDGNASRIAELWDLLQPHSAIMVPIVNHKRTLGVLSLAYAESGRTYSEDDRQFLQEFGYHLGVVIENNRLYSEIDDRDQAKVRFITAISHELRNPLAPIKHSLELLRLSPSLEKNEELALVEHQFDHLAKLLDDFLDIGRYSRARVKLTKTPLELCGFIEEVMRSQRLLLAKKSLSLEMKLPGAPVMVAADALRLEQALINLVHNAEKFTPSGGRITVVVTPFRGSVTVAIRDTGIGIADNEMDKIFEPYFQGERSLPGNGLGMGLALVHEIVKLHGGAIRVESEGEGRGSTFTITLPLLKETASTMISNTLTIEPEKEVVTPASSGKRKILVIDDNMAAADALTRLLEAIGFSASGVYSSEEAIEEFAKVVPDIAIVDIGLPGMSGHELIHALRKKHGTDFVAIALSGYGLAEDKEKAQNAGFNHHLTKPAGLAEIREVLARFA
jgi:PAS domain S-box-containing protein